MRKRKIFFLSQCHARSYRYQLMGKYTYKIKKYLEQIVHSWQRDELLIELASCLTLITSLNTKGILNCYLEFFY